MAVQVRSSARQRRPLQNAANTPIKSSPKSKPLDTNGVADENTPPTACVEIEVDTCFATPVKRIKCKSVVKTTPIHPTSPFLEASKLFHRSTPTRIIGRSIERSKIDKFWRSSVLASDPDCRILYICGTPGTGKTALLDEMLPDLETLLPVRIIKKNCMMFEEAFDILNEIYLEITGTKYAKKLTGKKKKEALCQDVSRLLSSSKSKFVIILDEIDQLAFSDLSLLETVFGWAADAHHNTTVIGIANSIDLTARHVPATLQKLTETLYFSPYQMEDISAILTDRMHRANNLQSSHKSLIQPVAIELCSRKIAAIGDLRKALEIMQNALEIADNELGCSEVQMSHVLKAMERFAPKANNTAAGKAATKYVTEQLNMNSRMVLVSLILFQEENPIPVGTRLPYKKPTLQAIYDRYVQACNMSAGKVGTLMSSVSRDEFLVLLSDLETFSLINVVRGGASGGRKSMSLMPDWHGSVVKLAVTDRGRLVEELKEGGITRLFLL